MSSKKHGIGINLMENTYNLCLSEAVNGNRSKDIKCII